MESGLVLLMDPLLGGFGSQGFLELYNRIVVSGRVDWAFTNFAFVRRLLVEFWVTSSCLNDFFMF